MPRGLRAALLLALASSTLGAQCRSNDRVSFEVLLPKSVDAQAQWMEIGVLSDACPSSAQLAGGLPRSGMLERIAFAKGNTNPPTVGDLQRAPYAFATVARDGNCGVVATGCVVADLNKARDVSISLDATEQPTATCTSAESCVFGQCAPRLGSDNPTMGAGCSMQLVGAGPLGDPLIGGGETVTAPALAVSETGFLVAYREYDPAGGAARLTVGAIDASGGKTLAAPTTLPGQCPGLQEDDGIGLAYAAGAGVVLSARPYCSPQPTGLDGIGVDASGNVTGMQFTPLLSMPLVLSNAHTVALSGATSGRVAVLELGRAALYPLSGLVTQGSPVAFGAGYPQAVAEVATTDQMVALLAAGPSSASGSPGGAPGDGDGGPSVDAGSGPSTIQLTLGGPMLDAGAAPIVFPGTWGALAAQGGRAFVLSDSTDGSQTATYSAFDLGTSGPAAMAPVAPLGQGTVVGGDVAFHADRAFFAVEQPGSISIQVYDNASTTPSLLRSILMSDDPRVPSQAAVRDGRVAIAAADTRVAIAWVTAANLGGNDAVGGYAVYACSP
jgi:hypothetical protein